MRKTTTRMMGLAMAVFTAQEVTADVINTHENGFAIESVATLNAPAATVYQELGKVSRWWDPEHTWSGVAKNLSMQMQAGGCFCEKLADGGSIQHGRVIYAQPNVTLRLDAPLGPLQEMPVTGVLTFALAPADGGTKVTMTYRVAGALTMESAGLAPIVDKVMSTQLNRLKAHVDGLAR